MSSTLDEPTRPGTAPPPKAAPAFLYDNDADVPEGWELTEPARGSTIRLAFDPKRHTVVHESFGRNVDELIAAINVVRRGETPARHRAGSSSEPGVKVVPSPGSSVGWLLSSAPRRRSRISCAVLLSWQWRWSSWRLSRRSTPPYARGQMWSCSRRSSCRK